MMAPTCTLRAKNHLMKKKEADDLNDSQSDGNEMDLDILSSTNRSRAKYVTRDKWWEGWEGVCVCKGVCDNLLFF